MTEQRHNPFEGVTDFFSELTRIRSQGIRGAEAERTHASAWVPVTDIFASGDDLIVRLDLPGVKADGVTLTLADETLTIAGYRGGVADDVEFYVHESYHGEFRRVVSLPKGTRAAQLEPVLEDGVLVLTVRDALGSSGAVGERIELVDRSEGASAPVVQDGSAPTP